ncbi:hypothetical protein [Streptomyces sp. 147326]|uniref:hypothetical protein n=1 Tax=Streptomyces sp. 147326 TaxID=3074379 RepID=UPI003857E00F
MGRGRGSQVTGAPQGRCRAWEEGQAGERPATPGAQGLVAANATMLSLQTPEDVLDTRLRRELWDRTG